MQEHKTQNMQWINQAISEGARQSKACAILGISTRTLQRWRNSTDLIDRRSKPKGQPNNALSEFETKLIAQTANKPEYANLSPAKIVPALADTGVYIASESSFYRILKALGQLTHRLKSKPKRYIHKPRALVASMPNKIYSWDITYLPTSVKGMFYYLYLVMDVYSRKIVGWQIYTQELSSHASNMMKDICDKEGIKPDQVTLHSDNGGPMKGATMLATLQKLGIVPSFSRPSVSNDNPYSESLFRTLKYRPEYPNDAFFDLQAARNWVAGFVNWYNTEHLHSSIKYVTPQQRHNGDDVKILAKRKDVYNAARRRNPNRWSREIRDWDHVKDVLLNPDKQITKKTT
jgi:transposase InsO family protein